MSAPAHTRLTAPSAGGADARLPWWAIALPSVAFAALLLMIVGSGEAHAATADPTLGRLLERVLALLIP